MKVELNSTSESPKSGFSDFEYRVALFLKEDSAFENLSDEEKMIKANLENGTAIVLKNGEWLCDDPELKKMLNNSQDYWRAKEIESYKGSVFRDNSAAAKVLAQFGGDVVSITNEL